MQNLQAEMQRATRLLIQNFNRAHQVAVAINCCHIGDDNDYSCFLGRAVFELFEAGKKETAYRLMQTDPMLMSPLSMEDFLKMMDETAKLRAEEKERAENEWKLYCND